MSKILDKARSLVDLLGRFNDKDLMIYASSLSFHTILSVIPMLLIIFSVFTKIPSLDAYYETLKEKIFDNIAPSHPEVISGYIDTFLGNTIQMGIFGFVSVLIVSMMLFKNYENVFNKIMHASSRSFWQSLSSYWTLVTLAPILLAVSFYLSTVLQGILNSWGFSGINFLAIFPYLVVWALFFTIYMISSSAKVSIYSGVISSFLASFIWYMSKTLFVFYATYNHIYTTIYGPFSVVFFFILWIYCSWVIFLYGVRVCYILHTREQKKLEEKRQKIAETKKSDRKHKNPLPNRRKPKNDINSE